MRYTRIMSVLALEYTRAITLNTLLLFTVSIEPFLFNLFNSKSNNQFSDLGFYNVVSNAYGTDLGVILLVLDFLTSLLVDDRKKLIPNDLKKEFIYDAISLYVAGALFIVSAVIPVTQPGIGVPFRFDLWIIPFLISTVRRRGMSAMKEIHKLRSKK